MDSEKFIMRIDFKFRHSPQSEELTEYVTNHIDKLEKYEMKPVRMEFTFSTEKTCKRVDVHARGQDIEMHAHSEAEDFFTAVDQALDRIAKQLSRKKAKVQTHKAPSRKAVGMSELDPDSED
jgi:putative sigma-54 modulation protein